MKSDIARSDPIIVSVNDGVMLINPEILLKDIKKAFEEYIREVKENQETFGKLKERL